MSELNPMDYRHPENVEDARRLARYDEAIRLLRECQVVNTDAWAAVLDRKVRAFLAAEGKVAG